MDLTCQCCKQPITYHGKGRPPRYCQRCRPWLIAEQRRKRNEKYYGTEKERKNRQKRHKIYYKIYTDAKVEYTKEYYETHRERYARLRQERFDKNYHRRRYHRIQGRRESQRRTRQRPERQRYMRRYLKDYHRAHRERYHRRGTTDLGPRMKKKHGRPDYEAEMKVIQNQKKRLGI